MKIVCFEFRKLVGAFLGCVLKFVEARKSSYHKSNHIKAIHPSAHIDILQTSPHVSIKFSKYFSAIIAVKYLQLFNNSRQVDISFLSLASSKNKSTFAKSGNC